MTKLIKFMMTLLKLAKTSLSCFPPFSVLPRLRPKDMEKTSKPKTLTPSTVPGTGRVASDGIQVMLLHLMTAPNNYE